MISRKVLNEVFDFSYPTIAEMILYMMISVFNTMILGQFGGKTLVSAVSLPNEIIFTFVNIFIVFGLSVGISSLVSRQFGSRRYESFNLYASNGFFISLFFAFILTASIYFFCEKILIQSGAHGKELILGIEYMRISSIGAFFYMLTNTLNSLFRGCGDTKTPLKIACAVALTSFVLNFVLINGYGNFPFEGAAGSAVACSISYFTGFLYACYLKIKNKDFIIELKNIFIPKASVLRDIIHLSFPSSLEEAVFSLSKLIGMIMIMHMGTVSFVANQLTQTIESVSYMSGIGLGFAATTLVGIKVGEKNYKKAAQYTFACALIASAIMTICSIMFLFIPGLIIKIFIIQREFEVIKLATMCLMIAAFEQPFMAIALILGSALKGMGDTKTPFILSFISSCIIRLPLMYYFIYVRGDSLVIIWLVTVFHWFLECIIIIIIFIKRMKEYRARGYFRGNKKSKRHFVPLRLWSTFSSSKDKIDYKHNNSYNKQKI